MFHKRMHNRNIVNARKMLTVFLLLLRSIAGCFINMLLNSAGDRVELQKESRLSKLCLKLKTGKRRRGDMRG